MERYLLMQINLWGEITDSMLGIFRPPLSIGLINAVRFTLSVLDLQPRIRRGVRWSTIAACHWVAIKLHYKAVKLRSALFLNTAKPNFVVFVALVGTAASWSVAAGNQGIILFTNLLSFKNAWKTLSTGFELKILDVFLFDKAFLGFKMIDNQS